MKVLWLASWYPNKYEPVNGDFVQRHAKAVSQFTSVDVIHVVQLGKDLANENFNTVQEYHNLREFIYGFKFTKIGIGWIDKIRYNLAYQKFYLQIFEQYVHQFGKPDIIHVHVPMKAGLAALQIQKKYNIPYIVSEQASYYEEASPDNFYKRSFFFKANTRKVFQNAIAVTNVSATIGSVIQKMFQLNKINCVHNVVDTALFNFQPKIQSSVFQWIHVSTLGEQKNITGLLEAFKFVKLETNFMWHLTLVGPQVEPHQSTVSQLQLKENVSFIGEVKHASVPEYLQKANAFVLFSRHENFPCVIPEALCCGLPVVASKVGGVAEAIVVENGITVETNNTRALANALIAVMQNYTSYHLASIAEKARSKYSNKIIGEQFFQMYQTIKPNN